MICYELPSNSKITCGASVVSFVVKELRSQIRPTQFLAIPEITKCLRANDILDLVRLDRANGGRAQDIDHVAGEDFASLDVPRRAQATTLNDCCILFILRDELIGGAK